MGNQIRHPGEPRDIADRNERMREKDQTDYEPGPRIELERGQEGENDDGNP